VVSLCQTDHVHHEDTLIKVQNLMDHYMFVINHASIRIGLYHHGSGAEAYIGSHQTDEKILKVYIGTK
jgi:hypothetical protein